MTTVTNLSYLGTSSAMQDQPCDRDGDNELGANLSILYYFMFVFNLLCNGLVLVIIHRFEKLTTVTNILLLNLVLSSLIFMSSLPFWAVYMQLSHWIFGTAMCKIVASVYYLGLYSSVLFLTLLTFDRHLAVVYSMEALQMRNRRYAVISCVVIWLISGLACIVPMISHTAFTNNIDDTRHCKEFTVNITGINMDLLIDSGRYLQLILFFILPLAIIVYCYTRIAITVMSSRIVTKFKTVRLIFIIVLLFFMCWTPFNIVLLIHTTACDQAQRKGYALQVTRSLAYIYFCFSPIFYTFVGKKFQTYFIKMLLNRFPGLRKHICVQNCKTVSTRTTPNSL